MLKDIISLILIFILWHISLIQLLGCIWDKKFTASKASYFELFNPKWVYKCLNLNYFGVAVVLIAFVAVMPGCALCYYFYKLCTIKVPEEPKVAKTVETKVAKPVETKKVLVEEKKPVVKDVKKDVK